LLSAPVVECDLGPSWNISPRQPIVVVMEKGVRKLVTMRWGLIPSWANDASIGDRLINARSETIAEKPSFRRSFESKRCLIVADGFYEWKTRGKQKAPVYITVGDGGTFCMAGIYDTWRGPDGAETVSCAIVTTEANEFMRGIHHRMPVIVAPGALSVWLDPDTDPEALKAIMAEGCSAPMHSHEVSSAVNSPSRDGPDCILPAASSQDPSLPL